MSRNPDQPWWEGHEDLFPPDPDLEPLHQRSYLVRAWKVDDYSLFIRGAVMDLRPGEMMARRLRAAGGDDDGRPMTVHHMVVDITVGFPDMAIRSADVRFETHPQPACPSISGSYRQLVGLSIARGFTHKVRELFGGPRGCTHTTALLQAMAPVAVQCMFPMRQSRVTSEMDVSTDRAATALSESSFMRGTCHVWADDGEMWQLVTVGKVPPTPLPMVERVRQAGLDPVEVDPRFV